jgi:hypothetical protein
VCLIISCPWLTLPPELSSNSFRCCLLC